MHFIFDCLYPRNPNLRRFPQALVSSCLAPLNIFSLASAIILIKYVFKKNWLVINDSWFITGDLYNRILLCLQTKDGFLFFIHLLLLLFFILFFIFWCVCLYPRYTFTAKVVALHMKTQTTRFFLPCITLQVSFCLASHCKFLFALHHIASFFLPCITLQVSFCLASHCKFLFALHHIASFTLNSTHLIWFQRLQALIVNPKIQNSYFS